MDTAQRRRTDAAAAAVAAAATIVRSGQWFVDVKRQKTSARTSRQLRDERQR